MRSTRTAQEGVGACGSCLHGDGPCSLRGENMDVCPGHVMADGSSLRRAAAASLARTLEGDDGLVKAIRAGRRLHGAIYGADKSQRVA